MAIPFVFSRLAQIFETAIVEVGEYRAAWFGKVERDEDLKDALRRELDEELGIDAVIGRKIAAIQHTYASGAALELYFYRVDQFKHEIKNRIFRDVRWIDRKELTTYDFLEADVRLVRDISAGRLL